MNEFIICDACHKPTKKDDINVILEDYRINRNNQYYCGSCWGTIDYDKIIEKHQEFVNTKPLSRRRGRGTGLFLDKEEQ